MKSARKMVSSGFLYLTISAALLFFHSAHGLKNSRGEVLASLVVESADKIKPNKPTDERKSLGSFSIRRDLSKRDVSFNQTPTSILREFIHKGLKSFTDSVLHGRVRVFLTIMCAVCVSVELFEEALEFLHIPYIDDYVKSFNVHHGVLLLTVSNVLSQLSDLVSEVDEISEAEHKDKLKAQIRLLATRCFRLESDAANFYDHVAIELFGLGSAVNFPENLEKPLPVTDLVAWNQNIFVQSSIHESDSVVSRLTDEQQKAKLPEKIGMSYSRKRSKFRGVKWNPDRKAWQLSVATLGL